MGYICHLLWYWLKNIFIIFTYKLEILTKYHSYYMEDKNLYIDIRVRRIMVKTIRSYTQKNDKKWEKNQYVKSFSALMNSRNKQTIYVYNTWSHITLYQYERNIIYFFKIDSSISFHFFSKSVRKFCSKSMSPPILHASILYFDFQPKIWGRNFSK